MGNGRPGPQRWLDVGPERIEGWLASFAARHGLTEMTIEDHREIFDGRHLDRDFRPEHDLRCAPRRGISRIRDREDGASVGRLIGENHHFPKKTL